MSEPNVPVPPSLGEAARYWFKLGWTSFGGPAGQISLMHDELVERRAWVSPQRFLHALNYTMLLPGPEAQQLATYLGWLMHGNRGGLLAGIFFILPSLLILTVLAWAYLQFGHLNWVAGLFYGIKPAVVAIVFVAVWRLGRRSLTSPLALGLALAAFLALFVFALPFPLVILGAALIGWLAQRYFPQQSHEHLSDELKPEPQDEKKYLFDDDSPPPPHAYFCRRHTIGYLVIGISLWFLALLLLFQLQLNTGAAWVQSLTTLALFFSKAALVTFGGAYAVLPYVVQAAVTQYAWLSSGQMIDGLALGESTPGPLIMVLVFVGFLATAQQASADELFLAGLGGALVACFFTFLPSFIFIFIGAPMVEASRKRWSGGGVLASVSAAVVGVLLNLALVFTLQVIWPDAQGISISGLDWTAPDLVALALIGLAGLLLQVLRWSALPVLGCCGLLGILLRLFG